MFEQLGLIGCGLMGGSFALALKKAGLVKRVVGYSKSPTTTARALQMGVIDVEAPSALLAAAGADLVQLFIQRERKGHYRRLQQIVQDFAAGKITLIGDPGQQQKRNYNYHRHQQRVEQRELKAGGQPAGEKKDDQG